MRKLVRQRWSWAIQHWSILAAGLLLARFAYKVIELASTFPTLFETRQLANAPRILIPLLIVVGIVILLPRKAALPDRWRQLTSALREAAPGLLLAIIFFLVYYTLASVFNRIDFNTNNTFFAADTNSWRIRVSDALGAQLGMRAIHPLALLVMRPFVWLVSFLTGVDLFQGALLAVALVGSLSVFLLWRLLEHAASGERAFLFAGLWGLSTSALVFNSLIETYIFSCLFLILFFMLLERGSRLAWLAASGVGLFGITISNIVQSLIGLLLESLSIKRVLQFLGLVLAASALLTVINLSFVPNSSTFFDADESGGEFLHFFEGMDEAGWWTRTKLLGSNIFAYSVVAPQPFVQVYDRNERGDFPKFNMMQGDRLSRFEGTGKVAVWVWLAVLGAAAVAFGRGLRAKGLAWRPNRLVLALVGCLLFNFGFHVVYGFEPFLYSANWTYALILFAGLGLGDWAETVWGRAALAGLIGLLTLNNLSFLYFLMSRLAPYVLL